MTKKSVICIRPTMPQEKNLERERRKYLEPKEYKVFKKKETASFREYRLKKQCQSNCRSALKRQPQKQHQPRRQHFQ